MGEGKGKSSTSSSDGGEVLNSPLQFRLLFPDTADCGSGGGGSSSITQSSAGLARCKYEIACQTQLTPPTVSV